MRLFVAVTPPPEVLGALATAVAAARTGPGAPSGLRWTGPEDWHITLAFLGAVPGPVTGRLAPRLERAAARHQPFPLTLSGAGAFPAAARGRVLWCGLGGGRAARAALAALAASVAAAATRAGAAPPDAGRRFRPHLTLARARAPADLRDLVAALEPQAGRPWRVDRIELIDSHPGGQPRYTTVGTWPLNGDTLDR